MTQTQLKDEEIWAEIVNVLHPDKELHVKAIIKQSDILKIENKKAINRLLYTDKIEHVIEIPGPKPKWKLRNGYNVKKQNSANEAIERKHNDDAPHIIEQKADIKINAKMTDNYKWQWLWYSGQTNAWKAYKKQNSQFIESNFGSKENIFVDIDEKLYEIDMEHKQQIDTTNGCKTAIKRAASSSINKKNFHIGSVHISSFISTPCTQNESNQTVLCYIYHIKFQDDPYDSPIGIILSKEIDARYLKDIRFCVQTKKNEELKWKALIKKWAEQNDKSKKSVKFDKNNIHNTEISLELIKPKGNKNVHTLGKETFELIKQCNMFIFQTLDYAKNKNRLKRFQNESEQRRFYYICPLKYVFSGSDDLSIDSQCLERISLGFDTLDARQFINKLPYKCSLKYEIVEIDKKYTTGLGVSYGVHKEKFDNIRKERAMERKEDDKEDDVRSISSFQSFASQGLIENVNKLIQVNEPKLLKKAKKFDIILVREEKPIIENVLIVTQNEEITSYQLESSLSYVIATNCYPTGITCNLWCKLKPIQPILYRIEHFLNVIDLNEKLCIQQQNDEIKTDDNGSMGIDLRLLFEAMHRSPSTTHMNHQILNVLGSYVLKFISTLNSFITNPICDVMQIYIDVLQATHKKVTTHNSPDLLLGIAKQLNIISYAVLYDFDYERWTPPQFQDRTDNSLYDLGSFEGGQYLPSFLLQSIIGSFFLSAMNESDQNPMNNAINKTLRFLKNLGMIKKIYNNVILKEKFVPNVDDSVHFLKQAAISNKLKMNTLLQRSLQTVIEGGEEYKDEGITFDRLESLGDSVLDLLVVWFICDNLTEHIYNHQLVPHIFDEENRRSGSIAAAITQMRDIFVNNNSLGYRFVDGHLDEYIFWFDDDIKTEIQNYKTKIKMDKQIKNKSYDEKGNIALQMETQKSPLGFIEDNSKKPKWPLKYEAPKKLGDCFEALLGAIFVGSHINIFKNQSANHWNLRPCVDFLITYLGNHDEWTKFKWDKWTPNVEMCVDIV